MRRNPKPDRLSRVNRAARTLYLLASLAAGALCASFIDGSPDSGVWLVLARTLAVLMPLAVALYLTHRTT
jgi:hypothetical protein